jgi:hypothetical protein
MPFCLMKEQEKTDTPIQQKRAKKNEEISTRLKHYSQISGVQYGTWF